MHHSTDWAQIVRRCEGCSKELFQERPAAQSAAALSLALSGPKAAIAALTNVRISWAAL